MLNRNQASRLVFCAGLLAASLLAQAIPQRVNVPFKFNLSDKVYPAAMYYVRYEASSDLLEIMGQNREVLSKVRVITRLAPSSGARSNTSVRLVFDEVGGERYISEVWIPGSDGLLLRATSERHKHETVVGSAK